MLQNVRFQQGHGISAHRNAAKDNAYDPRHGEGLGHEIVHPGDQNKEGHLVVLDGFDLLAEAECAGYADGVAYEDGGEEDPHELLGDAEKVGVLLGLNLDDGSSMRFNLTGRASRTRRR